MATPKFPVWKPSTPAANAGELRHARVRNMDELAWQEGGNGTTFVYRHKWLSQATGGQKLGCSLYTVPPGKAAFPFHAHHGNEEAIFILQGEGTMRLGEERIPVRAGDYFAFPVDLQAHQLLNTSGADLVYLCMSTMQSPEVADYPDSGKTGVFGALLPGREFKDRYRALFKKDNQAGYYEGE
jgi:uncharacterized cupin superfamily protein